MIAFPDNGGRVSIDGGDSLEALLQPECSIDANPMCRLAQYDHIELAQAARRKLFVRTCDHARRDGAIEMWLDDKSRGRRLVEREPKLGALAHLCGGAIVATASALVAAHANALEVPHALASSRPPSLRCVARKCCKRYKELLRQRIAVKKYAPPCEACA